MKKTGLLVVLIFNIQLYAQTTHNYDNENVIYSIQNNNGTKKWVGIATDTPEENLTVNGNILIKDYGINETVEHLGLFFKNKYDGSNKYALSIFNYDDTSNAIFDAMSINAFDGIYFNTGSNDQNIRMIIAKKGNVGIGTDHLPSEKLHVEGNILLNTFAQSQETGGIFFRDGYTEEDIYNLSILNFYPGAASELGGPPHNALSINAYSGVYFNTGSNDKNTRMVVHENGNIGIGTEAPMAKLDIRGESITERMIINPPVDNNGDFFKMGELIGQSDLRLFNFGTSTVATGFSEDPSATDYVGYTVYSQNGNKRMAFSATNSETFFGIRDNAGTEIFKASRSPGIGSFIHLPKTDSRLIIGGFGEYLLDEGYKFVIKEGDAKIEGHTSIDGNAIIDGDTEIGGNANIDGNATIEGEISSKGLQNIVNHTTDFQYGIASTVHRVNTKALSVLLEENGSYVDKFAVMGNGNVKATEVEVKTNIFPDYVFEGDYSLMSLEHLETFIEEHKRLPNIPSAKEIIENGLELGYMQVRQMEKIEELTLHIIAQHKRIEKLEDLIAKLLTESDN